MPDSSLRIYETSKTRVEIGLDTVTKQFKVVGGETGRYRLEILALQRLKGLKPFPQLIETDDANLRLVMSRLPGRQPEHLEEVHVEELRSMMQTMLSHGVARHATPTRDLLLCDANGLHVVDFERVTLRSHKWSPVWMIACVVSKYHVIRHVRSHQPHMLGRTERGLAERIDRIRKPFVSLRPYRDRLKRFRRTVLVRWKSGRRD